MPFGRGKPFLSDARGFLNQLVGGWEVTGIARYNSAMPVNVNFVFDLANTGVGGPQRPDRILGQPARVESLMAQDKSQGWLNPDAFRMPAQYTFGNLGRNTERGPAFANWDLGIFKNFPLHGEKQMLQFRTELFNAFNNVNMGAPGWGYYGTANFGRTFSTQNRSREIQFALKFLF